MELNKYFGGKEFGALFLQILWLLRTLTHLNQLYRAGSVKKRRGTTLKCERSFTLNDGRTSKSLSLRPAVTFSRLFGGQTTLVQEPLTTRVVKDFIIITIIPFIRIKVRSYMYYVSNLVWRYPVVTQYHSQFTIYLFIT